MDADLTTGPDVSPAPDGSAAGGPAAGDTPLRDGIGALLRYAVPGA